MLNGFIVCPIFVIIHCFLITKICFILQDISFYANFMIHYLLYPPSWPCKFFCFAPRQSFLRRRIVLILLFTLFFPSNTLFVILSCHLSFAFFKSYSIPLSLYFSISLSKPLNLPFSSTLIVTLFLLQFNFPPSFFLLSQHRWTTPALPRNLA